MVPCTAHDLACQGKADLHAMMAYTQAGVDTHVHMKQHAQACIIMLCHMVWHGSHGASVCALHGRPSHAYGQHSDKNSKALMKSNTGARRARGEALAGTGWHCHWQAAATAPLPPIASCGTRYRHMCQGGGYLVGGAVATGNHGMSFDHAACFKAAPAELG